VKVAPRKRVIVAPPAPSVTQKGGAGFLERGKEALKRDRNKRAIRFFIQALRTGDKNIAAEAQELLGLARERIGQKRMAINEYKAYLKQFSKGEGADRVRKRLDNLVGVSKKRKLRRRSARRRSEGWRYYGTWAQTYYRGNSKVDTTTNTGVNEPTLTNLDQSSLISNLDFTVRNRTKGSDNRVVFSGDHQYDFIEDSDGNNRSDGRVRKAYVEHKDKEYNYFAKLGRQNGVLTPLVASQMIRLPKIPIDHSGDSVLMPVLLAETGRAIFIM
jgi:tetratricopeptide (TPR) repeat protein